MKASLISQVAACLAYKAAYVEHKAESPCGQNSCGKEQNAASVKTYDGYAEEAAAKGAQIMVFPEYGITGFSSYSKSSWYTGGYTEIIPSLIGQVPCDEASKFSGAPSVVSLSCTAKRYGIAMVANLMEYTGGKMYNTNVALDSDGAYLAKYHKRNLWGESNIDVPPVETVSFKTKFGETFGMFICADLIYQHPAQDLVQSGVNNYVMSLAWSNEMAQMQAMAYAQGWSIANRVNLVFANHHGTTESGSGILVSGYPVSQYYHTSSKAGPVMVGDVSHGLSSSVRAPTKPLARFDLSKLAAASSWSYGAFGTEVCSGSVCCTASSDENSGGYILAALDGTDTNSGMRWPAQICAVLPCSRAGSGCLTFQQPSGSLKSINVAMTGSTAVSIVPEVLGVDGSNGELLLTSDQLQFVGGPGQSTASVNVTSPVTLISVVLYGRGPDAAVIV